jgi:predicted outer membrane repeat protein
MNVSLQTCSFWNCTAFGGGGQGVGGGLLAWFTAAVTDASMAILDCVFAGNAAFGSLDGGQSSAGGIQVYYAAGATNASMRFVGCVFINNSASGNGDTSQGSGGGLMLNFGSVAKGTTIVLLKCRFVNNTASANGRDSDGEGGGLKVLYGATVVNASMVLTACCFIDNTASASGDGGKSQAGGIWVYYASATNASIEVMECEFSRNIASGGSISQGGAVYHAALHPGVTIVFIGCAFTDNHASESGGAIYAQVTDQASPNQPRHARAVPRSPVHAVLDMHTRFHIA